MGKPTTVKDEDLKKISGAGTFSSVNASPSPAGPIDGGTFSEIPQSSEVLPGDNKTSPKSDDLKSTGL